MNRKLSNIEGRRNLRRSISLPVAYHFEDQEKNEFVLSLHDLTKRRKARSLPRVDDQSNSAAPNRRQPHPFAYQALGFRTTGRGARLPEWPPPDPPPLTPLNFGIAHGPISHLIPEPPPWPPRPWWRRTGPNRPNGPVVHVTIDTTEVVNNVPVRLTDRPAHIGWASTTDDIEIEQEAEMSSEEEVEQQAEWNEVEDHALSGPFVTNTSRLADPGANHLSWAQIRVRTSSQEDQVPLLGDEAIGQSTMSAVPAEEIGMISLNSEDMQEESSFQIFFVVLDSNPTAHTNYGMNGVALVERIREHILTNYTINPDGLESYQDSSSFT